MKCFPNPVTDTGKARSVLDYETDQQLLEGLKEAVLVDTGCGGSSSYNSTTAPPSSSASSSSVGGGIDDNTTAGSSSLALDPRADWVLQNYNPETTQTQTLQEEYHRLQTLRSYDLLDLSGNPNLERLTAMTSRMLHCPIAYVGTMDLGRYNILAGKGLGTLKNVHRKVCCVFLGVHVVFLCVCSTS
jgi:hypothetical protein